MDDLEMGLRDDDLVMLVKVGKSAAQAKNSGELYELARKWWKASLTQAQRARRVLAVADAEVIAAYIPYRWEPSISVDTAGRVAFFGEDAPDRSTFVGRNVKHLYPQGASNPIRYTTVATVLGAAPASLAVSQSPQDLRPDAPSSELFLMLRLNQSWWQGMPAAELYESTRGYWVMSPSRAEHVTKVLAVAHGIVREAYEPQGWEPSPSPGEENRIGFEGEVAADAERWRDLDVSSLFPPGSQNPVKYVPAADLTGVVSAAGSSEVDAVTLSEVRTFEPGLSEQIEPLLNAMEGDLLWSMSRAAQELFHSNTLAWLMSQHPLACAGLRAVFEGSEPELTLQVWREWRHLDIVAQRSDDRVRFVVENKLYSIPYSQQLEDYAAGKLPWSAGHGNAGAPDTSYFLLTLMDPNFELPAPWRRVSYESVLKALGLIHRDHLGADADLVDRYRTLVHRLVELKNAVDPRRDLDGPFSVSAALGAELDFKWFAGPLQRMRFTGLAQAVSDEYGQQLALDVDISRSMGLITYTRHLSEHRSIGWQFQEDQLRLFVLVRDPGLAGKGKRLAEARAQVAEREYAGWVDFTAAESVLGELLEPKVFQPGSWQRFAPDFVYRYRKVNKAASTRELAAALAELTAYTQSWKEKP